VTRAQPVIPDDLVRSIVEGRCIAFVGAGVTAPVTGTWRNLLWDVAKQIDEPRGSRTAHEALADWLGAEDSPRSATADEYEGAAEYLRRQCPDGDLESRIKAAFGRREKHAESNEAVERVDARIQKVLQIPFKAVLTPNFDTFLPGPPSELHRSVYAETLLGKPSRASWWSPALVRERSWKDEAAKYRTIVKLHGDIQSSHRVVLSSGDHSRRLYLDPAYRTFMRSLMATHTFLYLGYSFTDAYLNAIRRELLAVFGAAGEDRAPGLFEAFAVMPRLSPVRREHFESYEGIHVIEYDLAEPPDEHRGFDDILEALASRATPIPRLREKLRGKTIVWIDPEPSAHELGAKVLGETSGAGDEEGGARIHQPRSFDDAVDAHEGADVDLVICHWGHRPERPSACEEFLRSPRRHTFAAPVIVFCDPAHAGANRVAALRAGAFDLTSEWWELFEAVDRALPEPA
jgi:hypothetical protein